MPGYGVGRLSVLDCPLSLSHCVDVIKSHLHLSNIRLARGVGQHMRKFDLSSCIFKILEYLRLILETPLLQLSVFLTTV